MSKSFRNVDNSSGAHLTTAAQRQKNDAASELTQVLSERFEILETIAQSEIHSIYLARDLRHSDFDSHSDFDAEDGSGLVRLKVLSESSAGDERQVKLFHLEARAAAKLSHENIIKTGEAEQINGIHFCVRQHKPGAETLRDLLKREGWFELNRALEIIKQIADALEHAHSLGVLHLTLQPEKILIERDGRVLVTGFGIESDREMLWAHHERSHHCAPQYISPEQVQCKQIEQRSDLYSLGIIMFEMLTDRVPFDSQDSISIKLKHLNRLPEPPHMFRPELPRLLCWLVMDLLKKKPDERPANVRMFQSVLQQCMASGLEAGYAVTEPAASFDSDSQLADGEQAPVESAPVQETPLFIEEEAPEIYPGTGEDATEKSIPPLIISEADAPANDDLTFADAEPQDFSGEVYSDDAPHCDRMAKTPGYETPLYKESRVEPPAAFTFGSQTMPGAAEATNRQRSHRLVWMIAVLLVAAACLVWALRSPRAHDSARVDQPALAVDSGSAGKSDQMPKPDASKLEESKVESLKAEAPKSETPKSETSKPLEPPTRSEALTSAHHEKLIVRNAPVADDKPTREIQPVATKEMPQQVKSPVLVPPIASTNSALPRVESSTPSGGTSTNTRPAEPAPSLQPPKREELPAPKMVRKSGDVLQNSAISRVRPVYPEAARAARVAGPVTVEVTVDEEGNVIAARAISGPDLLRDAAIDAARGWKWMPTRMDRARVKVIGTITLNFQR